MKRGKPLQFATTLCFISAPVTVGILVGSLAEQQSDTALIFFVLMAVSEVIVAAMLTLFYD